MSANQISIAAIQRWLANQLRAAREARLSLAKARTAIFQHLEDLGVDHGFLPILQTLHLKRDLTGARIEVDYYDHTSATVQV